MKILKENKEQYKNLGSCEEIINAIKDSCNVKFKESIDICIQLGINAKKSDENVRGSFILPYGIPKNLRIAAFVLGTMEDEVKQAGAEVVGLDDLVEEIKKTEKVNFDICFASIDVIQKLVPIAKILGKNKVMPNKKDGTAIKDVAAAIRDVKEGKKCMFRNDDAGYLHFAIAKSDFETKKIHENLKEIINYIRTLKPPKTKEMIKRVYISSTMGLGLEIPLRLL